MKRTTSLLLTLLFFSSTFTACWDYTEVEQLAVVAGCAIDKGTGGEKYHITAEIINMSGETKSPEPKSTLVESEGETFFEAVRNITARIENKLYWSNCQILIMGKDVAHEGILDVLDFFRRDHEPRPTIEVLVSSEATAKEILKQPSIISKLNSFEIDVGYENIPHTLAETNYVQLYQILNTLEGNTTALTLPILRSVTNNDKKVTEFYGVGVFKDDKLIGSLNPEDTRFFAFVINKVKGGILTFRSGDRDQGFITIEIFNNKTKIKPVYENEKLHFEISTVTTISFTDIEANRYITDESSRNNFIKKAESQLAADITRVIRNVQSSYGADIFGFGEIVSKQYPKLWDKIQSSWEEELPDLYVTVKSKINVRNSYLSK